MAALRLLQIILIINNNTGAPNLYLGASLGLENKMNNSNYKIITIGIINYDHRIKSKNMKYFYISYFFALSICAFALYFSDKMDVNTNILFMNAIIISSFLGIGTSFLIKKKWNLWIIMTKMT